jgi:hypothetical protein
MVAKEGTLCIKGGKLRWGAGQAAWEEGPIESARGPNQCWFNLWSEWYPAVRKRWMGSGILWRSRRIGTRLQAFHCSNCKIEFRIPCQLWVLLLQTILLMQKIFTVCCEGVFMYAPCIWNVAASNSNSSHDPCRNIIPLDGFIISLGRCFDLANVLT